MTQFRVRRGGSRTARTSEFVGAVREPPVHRSSAFGVEKLAPSPARSLVPSWEGRRGGDWLPRSTLVVVALAILFFVASALSAEEDLLLKIPENTNAQLRYLQARYGIKLRYRTGDFSIVQANRSALPELSNALVLDVVSPDYDYYVLWLPAAKRGSEYPPLHPSYPPRPTATPPKRGEETGERAPTPAPLLPTPRFAYPSEEERGDSELDGQARVEAYGEIIERFNGFTLLKLRRDLEPILYRVPMHYRARLPAEMTLPEFDAPALSPSVLASPQQQAVIRDMLNQVSTDRWVEQILRLVVNEDLTQPGRFFNSRYSLRVRDAVQFDGLPEPDYACDNAADFIAAQFRSYGLEVEFDPFNHRRSRIGEGVLGEYVMRNVVATLPGKGPNKARIYLAAAHYDSISSKTPGWEENWRTLPAPGASDNASGVAEILEAARLLSQHDFDFTIQFVAFSGEELFLFGSRHYAERVKERGEQIAGVLNFDLLGHDEDGVLDIHVLGDEQSQWLVNAFARVAERYNIPAELRLKNDSSFIFSDHSPFWEISVPAVMVSEESTFEVQEESTAYIHSQEDTLAKITVPIGELAIQLATATIAELARPIVQPTDVTQPAPDIFWEPAEILVSTATASVGEPVQINGVVKNAGPSAVAGVAISFNAVSPDGKSVLISEQTVELDVNETRAITATFTPTQVGVFTIRALINNDARVFEADFSNNRAETQLSVTANSLTIERLAAYPNPVNFKLFNAALKLKYALGRDADVVVRVYDAAGTQILEQEFRAGDNGGRLGENDAFSWNGRNAAGWSAAPGIYVFQITATDVDGESETRGTKAAVIW